VINYLDLDLIVKVSLFSRTGKTANPWDTIPQPCSTHGVVRLAGGYSEARKKRKYKYPDDYLIPRQVCGTVLTMEQFPA